MKITSTSREWAGRISINNKGHSIQTVTFLNVGITVEFNVVLSMPHFCYQAYGHSANANICPSNCSLPVCSFSLSCH
jgi:hypothetical protein